MGATAEGNQPSPRAIKTFHPDASPFTDQLLRQNDQLLSEAKEMKQLFGKLVADQAATDTRVQMLASSFPTTQIASDLADGKDPLDKHLHDQIDTYRALLKDRPRTAFRLLTQLRTQVWHEASNKIRFLILGNLGAAHHRLAEYEKAADLFLEAAEYDKEVPAGIANNIAALLIRGQTRDAHKLALNAVERYPENAQIAIQRLQARAQEERLEGVWRHLRHPCKTIPSS